MIVKILEYNKLDGMFQKSVDAGYEWGCECGESFRTRDDAESCRKCRAYLLEPPTTVYYTKAQ